MTYFLIGAPDGRIKPWGIVVTTSHDAVANSGLGIPMQRQYGGRMLPAMPGGLAREVLAAVCDVEGGRSGLALQLRGRKACGAFHRGIGDQTGLGQGRVGTALPSTGPAHT